MKNAFNVVRQVLLSLPLAIAWILCWLLLVAGWGLLAGDKFIMHWNAMVNDESDYEPTTIS